jgi:hypothetical protein
MRRRSVVAIVLPWRLAAAARRTGLSGIPASPEPTAGADPPRRMRSFEATGPEPSPVARRFLPLDPPSRVVSMLGPAPCCCLSELEGAAGAGGRVHVAAWTSLTDANITRLQRSQRTRPVSDPSVESPPAGSRWASRAAKDSGRGAADAASAAASASIVLENALAASRRSSEGKGGGGGAAAAAASAAAVASASADRGNLGRWKGRVRGRPVRAFGWGEDTYLGTGRSTSSPKTVYRKSTAKSGKLDRKASGRVATSSASSARGVGGTAGCQMRRGNAPKEGESAASSRFPTYSESVDGFHAFCLVGPSRVCLSVPAAPCTVSAL